MINYYFRIASRLYKVFIINGLINNVVKMRLINKKACKDFNNNYNNNHSHLQLDLNCNFYLR